MIVMNIINYKTVVHGGGHLQVLPAAIPCGHGRSQHELRHPAPDPDGGRTDPF